MKTKKTKVNGEYTTIRIKKSTIKRLDLIKKNYSSYDAVIVKFLNDYGIF